jgi:hypothetical protein
MKFFTKFDDETFEEAKGETSSFYDSIEDAVDDTAGFIGEETPFEIYDTTGKFHARYTWQGGTPMKSNIPREVKNGVRH